MARPDRGPYCYRAPPRDRVTTDDDLGLFPPDSLSVSGQELLERGFPQDASSSDLVLIYQRKNGRLTPVDLRFVDGEASSLSQFAQEHPELGVNKIDTHRSPVIGPQLGGSSIRWSQSGGVVDRLAEQHVPFSEDAARGRPDPGMDQRKKACASAGTRSPGNGLGSRGA